MLNRRLFLVLSTACSLTLLVALPAASQQVLYSNGPDGNVGYYQVNFGGAVANSFVLSRGANISEVNLTIYCVDDGNPPLSLKWSITAEPFGGQALAAGLVNVTLLGGPYPTRFQFFAWPASFALPNVALPAGTYYLQIQDVITRWHTFAFWAQSSDGDSAGYYEPIGPSGAGDISLVPSESFSVLGEWDSREQTWRR
jgi:hypothetical protein